MRLEESFEVDAPPDEVWKALIDVQRVAPCLPGAEITEAGEDGSYTGSFQVKLGPTTASYTGTLKLESVDEAARVATMNASGRDKRGQGGAKATMVSTVTESGNGGARVHVDTDFTITGRLARFGRGGMIQDISKRLLGDFAACLQEELKGSGAAAHAAPPPPNAGSSAIAPEAGPSTAAPAPARRASKPVSGLGLLLAVLRQRVRRLLARRRGSSGDGPP